MFEIVDSFDSRQEAASPVEEVTSLGKDAVLGDPEAQRRAKHHHRRQQEVEVLPEHLVTKEACGQVRQDHQHRVQDHLEPEPTTQTGSKLKFLSENGLLLGICLDYPPQTSEHDLFHVIRL